MSLPKLIECGALKEAMQKFSFKKGVISKLKILDCTYAPTPPLSYQEFEKEWFGKFDKLHERMSKHKFLYLREHIPGAIFLDVDAAFYPGSNIRFSVYEPKVFEAYAQLLGLNKNDHLVFYGRGQSLPAMIFAARLYWLFKSYGHENLSVLNGGFNSWKEKFENEVESSDEMEKLPMGNWTAQNQFSEFNVNFNGLNSGVFNNLKEVNFIDCRTRPQYDGDIESGLDAYNVEGSNISGTKNIPVIEMLTEKGERKSEAEITKLLQRANFLEGKPTFSMCMVGMQASLMSFILDSMTVKPVLSKLYGGSLYEVGRLNPKLISGGKHKLKLN